MSKKLTTRIISMENIRRKPLRSFYIITLVSLFTAILYIGSIFSISLSKGLESLSDRLGADIIVVPAGYKANIEGVLLKGEASTFYLPSNTTEKLSKYDEIEKMTPQTYIATLSASCCSYPVQIIGIDMETDFLISPWLSSKFDKKLSDDEVITGNHINGEKGETIKFFENDLKIVGKLNQTGMGFDATVFVNKNTAQKIAKSSERIQYNRVANEDLISCVMIRVKPGVDSVKLASKISRELAKEGIFAMFSKKFINSISSNLNTLSRYTFILILGLLVLLVIILGLIFNAIFNERRKEMGVLRVLGASNKKLRNIIMTEAIILSLYGSFLGVFIGSILCIILVPIFANFFGMPFLNPNILTYIFILIISLIVGTFIGPLTVMKLTRKIGKKDSYDLFREQ